MNKKHLKLVKVFRFKRFSRKSYSVFNSIRKVITIGVLSGCALTSAHAASVHPMEKIQIETSPDTIPLKELDEVVVTASKMDLPLNLVAKQVVLISRKEVERTPIRGIEDLLNHVAGVDVLQRGPHGVQADISLRGGSFDQVAILLNGINLSNPQTGHYSFDIPINLSDIERIEIVQGPSSLAFGASAFSGGINIITKKDARSNAFAKLEAGMHGLLGAETRGTYKTGNSVNQLSFGYKRSDGYIENSDYKIVNLLWQSRFNVNHSLIDFQAGLNDKKYGANTFYSAAFPNQYDEVRGIFASVRGETNGKLKFIPRFHWSRHYDEYHLFRPGTPGVPSWYTSPNHHRCDVFGLTLNMQYASNWGITSFGSEFRNEGILSNNLGRPMREPSGEYTRCDNRSNISFFADHHFVFNKLTLSIGGLYNYNTALADTLKSRGFYPAVNLSFHATDEVKLFTSWSKATRMPTFTDLYYNAGKHRGFSGLTPEYTRSAESGIQYNNAVLTANLNAFYTKGDNLIDWILNPSDDLYHARNLASLTTCGFGLDMDINLQQWLGAQQPLESVKMGYQYITQKSSDAKQNNPVSMYIFNYLRHKFTASLQHRVINNLTVSWNLRWQERAGSYQKYVPGQKQGITTAYTPFALLDVKASYQFQNIHFFVNANNIFDSTHVDYGNIPQPGFWMSGGMSYAFK